jgi:flagella basal body P-ring formation protein FlgA
MFNKSIVTGFAGMLLVSTTICHSFAASSPTNAEQVPQIVEAAARQHVLRWADNSGLIEPKFELNVLRGSRPLAACAQAVTVEALDTRTPNRMKFAAVCPAGGAGAPGWRYEFVARAQVSARIAVAANDVPAGKIIADEDVLLERHDISGIADPVSDPAEVVGMSGKRALRGGEVLRMALLSAPTLVKRGEAVRIVARNEQVEVSMGGEALDAGARGSLVRVRNASGTIIRAKVTGAGTVQPADMPVTISR